MSNTTRRTRLRNAARDLLARYDVGAGRIRLLHDEFNCSYRVQGRDGRRFVLRLSSLAGMHGEAETRAEVAWLHALARDTDRVVPRPVMARDGTFVQLIDPSIVTGYRQGVLFEWLPGRTLGGGVGRRTAHELGRLQATLHEHGRSFVLPADASVRRFERVFPYADEAFDDREPIRVLDDDFRATYDASIVAAYEVAVRRAQDVNEQLHRERAAIHLIHGDLHPWNVLVTTRGLAPIDFEDLMWGHPAQDIATTLYYVRIRDQGGRRAAAYRAGYETVARWPIDDDAMLGPLLANRGLILANTVLTAPDDDVRAEAGQYIPLIGRRLARWLAIERSPENSAAPAD